MAESTTIVRLEVSAGGAVRVLSDVGQAGEQSAQKLQDSFGKAAAGAAQLAAAVEKSRQSFVGAQQAAFQEISVLQQKIAIQRQAIAGTVSLTDATRKEAEAEIFAKTGSREHAQQLAALRVEYERNAKAIQGTQAQVSSFNNAIGLLQRGLLAIGVVFGAQQVVQYADTYRLLEGRLKLVTSSSAELASVQSQLFQIAQRTSSSYESVVQTFTRASRAQETLGVSQQQILKITETLGNALKVSGASSVEASAAMLQLSQAFQSGVLQGDEFRSLAEQMPLLLDLVAKEMGRTRGELKQLGSEGKITGEILAQTLLHNFDQLQAQAAKLPTILGQATTIFSNAFLQFVGQLDKATGSTATLAAGIKLAAGAIDEAAVALAAFAAVGIVANIGSITTALGTLATAIGIVNVALLANPWVIIGTAVAAFGVLLYKSVQQLNETRAAFKQGRDAVENMNQSLYGADGAFGKAADAARNAKAQIKDIEAAMKSAASASASLAQELAKISNNTSGLLSANVGSVFADLAQKIREAGTNAQLLAAVQQESSARLQHAYLDTTQAFIGAENEKLKTAQQSADAQTAMSSAVVDARGKELQATQQVVNAQAEQAKATGNISQYLVLIQKSADLEQQVATARQQSAAIAVKAANDEIAARQRVIEGRQAELALEQGRATGGDKVAANNVLVLTKEIQNQQVAIDQLRAKVTQARGEYAAGEVAKTAATLKSSQQIQAASVTVTKVFLEELQKRVVAARGAADAEVKAQLSTLAGQSALLTSQEGLVQARLEYVKVFNSGTEVEISLTKQIIALQKQQLDNAVAQKQVQLDDAQAELASLARQEDQILRIIATKTHGSATEQAEAKLALDDLNKVTTAYQSQVGTVRQLTDEQQALGQSIESAALRGQLAFQQLNAELARNALVSTGSLANSFDQIIDGILQGTQKLSNILSSAGQAIGAKFFKQLLVGKNQNLDIPLIGNVSQLFLGNSGGIIGSIFGQGGQAAAGQFGGAVGSSLFGGGGGSLLDSVFSKAGSAAASIFGSSFFGGGGQTGGLLSSGGLLGGFFSGGTSTAGAGIFSNVIGGSSSTAASSGFGGVFSGANILGGFAGSLIGGGINSLLGIGQSKPGQIGAGIGGGLGGLGGGLLAGAATGAAAGSVVPVIGTIIGAIVGTILGAFGGDLLAHVPTKGTQIRKAVRAWLNDLDVEFADQISAKKYGFGWIKDYADRTGTDFLEASKHFIPENFGSLVAQGLDKQLLAIGIASTKGQAEKLGKSLEQTGFTFANMIVDNLGGDTTKISTFINDLVDKGNFNFDNVAKAVTDAFNTHAIGLETFQAALAGTVSLFLTDYPKAVDVARVATESFAADGTFNLDIFKQKLEDNKAAVALLQQAVSQPIAQGSTGQITQVEVSKQTKDNIITSIRDAVTQGFITGFINAAFESSGLAVPLAHIQELIRQYTSGAINQADFLGGVQTTLQAADPAIERFAQAAGVASAELHSALAAAGLLPGAIDSATAAAQQAAAVIKDGLAKHLKPDAIAANFQSVIKNAIITSVADAVVAGFVKAALATAALTEPLQRIQKLIADYLANTLTPEQFAAGLKAAFADAEPAIRRAAAAIGLASTEVERFLGALDVGFTSATDSADGLVAKIKEISALLRDLTNARIQVQIDLASQLGSVGALTPTQVIAARETPLIPTVDRAIHPIGPIGTSPFAGTSDATLQRGFDALGQMADLAVERFQAYETEQNAALKDRLDAITKETKATIDGINEATKATIDGIHAEFDAKRATGQAVIDGLQRQKDLQQEVFQNQLDALKTQLQAAQEFKRVSESIQQTINSLAIGKDSTLAGPEKLAFLQRQASELRGNTSADAVEKLSKNLESQLQVGHDVLTPEQFAAKFSGVITELQNLRDRAAIQGNRAEDIQHRIEATQAQMKATLDSIDGQIKAQQKYIQSLATDENNAVAAAQKAGAARIEAAQLAGDARLVAAQAETKAAIDAYRVVIIARLQELAAARDRILGEQLKRAEEARDLLKQQLTDQLGAEEADRLLREPMVEIGRQLFEANANLVSIRDTIQAFLGAIHPAASGFYSPQLPGNQLFLAHQGEEVSIAPPGQARSAPVVGGSSQSTSIHVDVTLAPVFTATLPESSTSPEEQGARFMRGAMDSLTYSIRHEEVGEVIVDKVKYALRIS